MCGGKKRFDKSICHLNSLFLHAFFPSWLLIPCQSELIWTFLPRGFCTLQLISFHTVVVALPTPFISQLAHSGRHTKWIHFYKALLLLHTVGVLGEND